MHQTPSGALSGPRPVASGDQRFDSEHTGLDHLSFMVDSRDEFVAAQRKLDEAGVEHCEVTDFADAGMAILSSPTPTGCTSS